MTEFPKISEPGVYDLPIDVYHGDCCDAPSISSSGLRAIETGSPRHYWVSSPYNPARIEVAGNKAMRLGSAAHHLLLGEDGFSRRYSVRPAEFKDWRSNAAKDWRGSVEADGVVVLVPDELETIKRIAESLHEHPVIRAGLLNGDVEKSLFARDGDIWLKSRPDTIPADSNIIVDLKTTTDASEAAVRRRIVDGAYHMQLALVGDLFKRVLGREPDEYVLVFVETGAPWSVNVTPVDKEWVWYGHRQNRRAIERFREGIKTGQWPGYDDDGRTACIPDWYRRRLEEDDRLGLLPAA